MAKHGNAFGGGYFFPHQRDMGLTGGNTVKGYLNYGAPDHVKVTPASGTLSGPTDRLDRQLAAMRHAAASRKAKG
jgi:hypothetical protein